MSGGTIASERSQQHAQAPVRDRIAELIRDGESLGFLRNARLFVSELTTLLAPLATLTTTLTTRMETIQEHAT